jgi:hypothetical protein
MQRLQDDITPPTANLQITGGRCVMVSCAVQAASGPRAGIIPPGTHRRNERQLLFAHLADTGQYGGEMSRTLPSNPSLEYLKKQAKDLLQRLQERDAAVQLADAQHELARSFGFASWPRLKAHVEELTSDKHALHGKWKLDPQRSTANPDLPIQAATLDITVESEIVTIADVTVTESRERHRAQNTLVADVRGRQGDYGYTVIARWLGAHGLDWTVQQNGQEVAAGRYEVSDDGRSFAAAAGNRKFMFIRY